VTEPIDILIGIDGTHDNRFQDMAPTEYDMHFAHSHVRLIVKHSRFARSHYVRGPAGSGTYVNDKYMEALDHIEQHVDDNPAAPVRLHLTGFSRGAAMALDLGNWLLSKFVNPLPNFTRFRAEALRKKLSGRLTVPVMALFDPVDMSSDIDGRPISRLVSKATVIRRSAEWGSRLGWHNVGDTPEQGTPPGRRDHITLKGTHGAMGGMPLAGDIPKALACALLQALPNDADWDQVENRYQPFQAKINALSRATMWMNGAPGLVNELARQTRPAILSQTYRKQLHSYAFEPRLFYGLPATQTNEKLGSFPKIDGYFRDFPICLDIIRRYRMHDVSASAMSLRWMVRTLGDAFPAVV
jgi:hypothetical protein